VDKFDICIVGAGVIGLSIARALSQTHKHSSIVVLEQESGFGQHTSSRNSEVIHAGLYYPAESLKARLCVRGKHLLYEHCDQHGIPDKRLGKYIVAQEHQTHALEQLAANAATNGVVDLSWVSQQSLQKAEPALRASSALFSPSTGILDSHSFMQSLLALARSAAVEFAPFTTVEHIEWNLNTFTITNSIRHGATKEQYQFQSSILINCGGLYAAAIAATITGSSSILAPKIFFCKGDYFTYGSRSPLQHLVYPVPEKNASGLGIHATLDLSGQIRFGPDAQYIDSINYAVDPHKAVLFAQAISNYFPGISADKLVPAYAGIRPKLAPAGSPAQDFQIQDGRELFMPGLIQLFGIESPGLTASLAIGEYVRDLVRSLGN